MKVYFPKYAETLVIEINSDTKAILRQLWVSQGMRYCSRESWVKVLLANLAQ